MGNDTFTGGKSGANVGIGKVATNIDGLDEILRGGVPAGRTTLIAGGPGTGKSMFGLEFLYRGARSGHPGIFLSFEESKESVRENCLSLGWDLASLEKEGRFFLVDGHVDSQVLVSGDFNMNGLLAIVSGKAQEMGADRIVIDAVDMLMRVFDDPKRAQNETLTLHDWLNSRGMTSILTAKSAKNTIRSPFGFLDFMADCVIYLDQRIQAQVNTKRLQVVKYRGSGYGGNEYPFLIADNGIHLNPVSGVEMALDRDHQRTSSGDPTLDAILGGGYHKGTCVLVSGLTGTGKTATASTFVRSACGNGQKVLYISYEESAGSMVQGMLSLGIDLRPPMESGCLEILSVMPESMGIEEHLFRIVSTIKRFKPDHIVLDAMSAVKRIAGDAAAFDFVVRLVDFCKETGATMMLINQGRGFHENYEFTGIGLSSIIDTILILDYKDTGTELKRVLLVLKSRGANHSNKYHPFILTDHGMRIEREPDGSSREESAK